MKACTESDDPEVGVFSDGSLASADGPEFTLLLEDTAGADNDASEGDDDVLLLQVSF